MGWIQTFLGTSKNFVQDTATSLPHMLDGWFHTLRQFLQESECSIHQPDAPEILPRRQGDRNIMDDACSSLSATDVTHINWCRLYLQVEYLSDMTTIDGTSINPKVFIACKNQNPEAPSKPIQLFPVQGIPGPAQWLTWHKFITTNYCCSPDNLKLRKKSWDNGTTITTQDYGRLTLTQQQTRCTKIWARNTFRTR